MITYFAIKVISTNSVANIGLDQLTRKSKKYLVKVKPLDLLFANKILSFYTKLMKSEYFC